VSILLGEAAEGPERVVLHAQTELAGHAGVERAVAAAGHDVDGNGGVTADHAASVAARPYAASRAARLGPGSTRSASASSGMTDGGWGSPRPVQPARSRRTVRRAAGVARRARGW